MAGLKDPPYTTRGSLWKLEREELARVIPAADRNDDVLFPVPQVGHRRAGLRRWHVNRPDVVSRRLVVRAKQRAALPVGLRGEPAFARNEQRLRHEDPDPALSSRAGNRQPLQCGMILDV